MYNACRRMLRGRLRAINTVYDPNERFRGDNQLFTSKQLSLSKWVTQKHTMDLFVPGCESLWHGDQLFDWNYIDNHSPENPAKDPLAESLCYTLRYMRNVTKHRLLVARKFVLAAYGMVGNEGGSLPPVDNLTDYNLPYVAVKDAFQCAMHYHQMQTENRESDHRSDTVEFNCIDQLSRLVDSIYGCIEALAVIRAHYLHLTHTDQLRLIPANVNASFHKISGTVKLRTEALAPLVSFLALGFKGLLTYWRSPSRTPKTGLIQLCLVTSQMGQQGYVEEPIWKRSSSYVLTTI
ncbi:uncharacterized protein MELLADRAFT_107284 [Melampsora larici-populina 98AG31]|uniref:Uncharacterized protein n=1 Tax=Melampsora larici-populina (strain 98AG31 / pathotype 3-4-7) TaxID=747676 RepID=F4RNT9_MELLP|nr:uncharacterized protein MELLADRAFT_107284 [Melampsora larici-populina 98AG31]EGG05803.1 hypothetical protein MELLADRAFT_107284 [Melampsora larici-populina 98AG31]